MVPADDQAMVLPCASVMVIMVLLNDALTCATPEAMFFRSRRRTRPVASLPIHDPFGARLEQAGQSNTAQLGAVAFFLPAMALAGPLRVRALVWVRWPRTGRPRRWRRPTWQPRSISRLLFISVS